MWAYGTGAGWLGAILVGIVAAGLTFGLGQILLVTVRPTWARLLVAAAFVAPPSVAGFHAPHVIVSHTMPSWTWPLAVSVLGSFAAGSDASVRLPKLAVPGPFSWAIP